MRIIIHQPYNDLQALNPACLIYKAESAKPQDRSYREVLG